MSLPPKPYRELTALSKPSRGISFTSLTAIHLLLD